jgi:hypothetical protein
MRIRIEAIASRVIGFAMAAAVTLGMLAAVTSVAQYEDAGTCSSEMAQAHGAASRG